MAHLNDERTKIIWRLKSWVSSKSNTPQKNDRLIYKSIKKVDLTYTFYNTLVLVLLSITCSSKCISLYIKIQNICALISASKIPIFLEINCKLQ